MKDIKDYDVRQISEVYNKKGSFTEVAKEVTKTKRQAAWSWTKRNTQKITFFVLREDLSNLPTATDAFWKEIEK